MKSTEVYSQLKAVIGPWFKSEGFKRAKGFLGWTRSNGKDHIVVWCQVSQDGWDSFAGSKFVVEFQLSSEPIIGHVGAHRQRLVRFLTPEAREEIRNIQNSLIATLHHPPSDYPLLHISQQVTDSYLAQFKPITKPYNERDDIWFRYASPEHVTRWGHFIIDKLPKCISVVQGWANNTIQLSTRSGTPRAS
jgi:hypothetical protein